MVPRGVARGDLGDGLPPAGDLGDGPPPAGSAVLTNRPGQL